MEALLTRTRAAAATVNWAAVDADLAALLRKKPSGGGAASVSASSGDGWRRSGGIGGHRAAAAAGRNWAPVDQVPVGNSAMIARLDAALARGPEAVAELIGAQSEEDRRTGVLHLELRRRYTNKDWAVLDKVDAVTKSTVLKMVVDESLNQLGRPEFLRNLPQDVVRTMVYPEWINKVFLPAETLDDDSKFAAVQAAMRTTMAQVIATLDGFDVTASNEVIWQTMNKKVTSMLNKLTESTFPKFSRNLRLLLSLEEHQLTVRQAFAANIIKNCLMATQTADNIARYVRLIRALDNNTITSIAIEEALSLFDRIREPLPACTSEEGLEALIKERKRRTNMGYLAVNLFLQRIPGVNADTVAELVRAQIDLATAGPAAGDTVSQMEACLTSAKQLIVLLQKEGYADIASAAQNHARGVMARVTAGDLTLSSRQRFALLNIVEN